MADEHNTVTQEDRNCLAEIVSEMGLLSNLTADHIRSGLYDQDAVIVTRHRLQSLAPYVEALREAIASQAKFAGPEPAAYFREFGRRIDALLSQQEASNG